MLCCISFVTGRDGQPVTLELSATPTFFFLLRLPSCPAPGLGSDRLPGIWRELEYPAGMSVRETASGEQLAPLPLTSCTFLGTAMRRTSTWGLEQIVFNCNLCSKSSGITGTYIF